MENKSNIIDNSKFASNSISLCIATHERPSLLEESLKSIALQKRLPDEIIISDSSVSSETESVVKKFRDGNPELQIKYLKSKCKALPYHRWNAFENSRSEIILFIDDDISLLPDALEKLINTYLNLYSIHGKEKIAGIGFYIFLKSGSDYWFRNRNSLEEKWLGVSNFPSVSITPGGIAVTTRGIHENEVIEVDRLSGGGMSFRRSVLDRVGYLDHLVELYNLKIGRSEDRVLSYYAHKYGRLFLLTEKLAIHPDNGVHSATANNGWHMGLIETYGRAHSMLWTSSDPRMYKNAWLRVASLELFRSLWLGVIKKPFQVKSWTRFIGSIYGIIKTFIFWNKIPSSARTSKSESHY